MIYPWVAIGHIVQVTQACGGEELDRATDGQVAEAEFFAL